MQYHELRQDSHQYLEASAWVRAVTRYSALEESPICVVVQGLAEMWVGE